MAYAVFVVLIEPSPSNDEDKALRNFAGTAKDTLANAEGVTMLNHYTFVCNLASGSLPFSNLVRCAKDWGVPFQTLFLEHEPLWSIS